MTDRKTLSVTADSHDRADAVKHSDESWTDYLHRATAALEAAETDSRNDEHGPNTVAVENVDEIARRTASEVEDRMTRR